MNDSHLTAFDDIDGVRFFMFSENKEELLENYPDFGKTTVAYRLNNRATILEMARAIGVSPAQLSGMEWGRNRAPMHIVYRLAKYMELSKKQRKQFRKNAEWVNKNYRQIREKRDEELKHAWSCGHKETHGAIEEELNNERNN